MLLARAGDDWSVLVPEGKPWLDGAEPVDRVLTGWATALAVGAPWPVLALWWDADRSGYTLASGFRRPVGYVWLANGTPVGEDEAMRTFAARLGLDPVLDMQSLEPLTRPDSAADARARLRGLLAVLTRAGRALPAGLAPGEPADRLLEAAARPAGRRRGRVAGLARCGPGGTGRRRAQPPRPLDAWGPRARALARPRWRRACRSLCWGLRRRSGGWVTAGGLLLVHGALGLAYALTHPRTDASVGGRDRIYRPHGGGATAPPPFPARRRATAVAGSSPARRRVGRPTPLVSASSPRRTTDAGSPPARRHVGQPMPARSGSSPRRTTDADASPSRRPRRPAAPATSPAAPPAPRSRG